MEMDECVPVGQVLNGLLRRWLLCDSAGRIPADDKIRGKLMKIDVALCTKMA
jgi:hypothetical protein